MQRTKERVFSLENHWDISKELSSNPIPETIISPIDGAEMVLVPDGQFSMGITEEELLQIFTLDKRETPVFVTEIPARTVYLKAYYIDRYPVTNYQYRKFIEDTGHQEPIALNHPLWGKPMHPVVFVGWNDARAYAKWTGKSLPTEVQWEKAGRRTELIRGGGHGGMNSSSAGVIQGNTVLDTPRKLASSTKE